MPLARALRRSKGESRQQDLVMIDFHVYITHFGGEECEKRLFRGRFDSRELLSLLPIDVGFVVSRAVPMQALSGPRWTSVDLDSSAASGSCSLSLSELNMDYHPPTTKTKPGYGGKSFFGKFWSRYGQFHL